MDIHTLIPEDVMSELILAIVAAGASVLTAYLQRKGNRRVDEINDAVNNRHEKDPGKSRKLYDLMIATHLQGEQTAMRVEETARKVQETAEVVDAIEAWQQTYADGPLNHGDRVKHFVAETKGHFERLDDQFESLHARLGDIAAQSDCGDTDAQDT